MTNNITEIGHNSQAATILNVKDEMKRIASLAKTSAKLVEAAGPMAQAYVAHALETRDCDLIRHLWQALPVPMQTRLVSWVKACAPIVKRTKKVKGDNGTEHDIVTFGIDKKAQREHGWRLLPEAPITASFVTWKRTKEAQALDFKGTCDKVDSALERALDVLADYCGEHQGTVLDSVLDIIKQASMKVQNTLQPVAVAVATVSDITGQARELDTEANAA